MKLSKQFNQNYHPINALVPSNKNSKNKFPK